VPSKLTSRAPKAPMMALNSRSEIHFRTLCCSLMRRSLALCESGLAANPG
jgi:hypothetical protein